MCNHYRLNPQDLENWAEWSGYTLRRQQEPVLGDVWPEKQASVVRRAAAGRIAHTPTALRAITSR